jgi:hypothetical protein
MDGLAFGVIRACTIAWSSFVAARRETDGDLDIAAKCKRRSETLKAVFLAPVGFRRSASERQFP